MTGIPRAANGFARLCVLALALAAVPAAAAQEADSAAIEARQAESRAEYDRISDEMALSTERLDKLAAEIAAVKKDHATITAALTSRLT